MKHYIFQIENIKLTTQAIQDIYPNLVKGLCFLGSNYPAATNINITLQSYDCANELFKTELANLWNAKYKIVVDIDELKNQLSKEKFELKTLTLQNPIKFVLHTDEDKFKDNYTYSERILINTVLRYLFEAGSISAKYSEPILPTSLLKIGMNDPELFNFSYPRYLYWYSWIGEVTITLQEIKD